MPTDIEQLKRRLLEHYAARLDNLFEEVGVNEELHLTEIETAALRIRQELSQELTQALVDTQTAPAGPDVRCPDCGAIMRNKGCKHKYVQSRSGAIEMERPYYYCVTCRAGHFPPR